MTPTRLAIVALALTASVAVGTAQQGPPSPVSTPPLPPARGTLTVTAEALDAVRAAVKAPAGFTVTAFATPPVVNYPTCVTATHDGVVFVCVDRNGSLQADAGMGYVVRLVDTDQNGQADQYTVFATMESPRGAVFDGDTLYVSHPPFITAFRDTDGDGISDDRRTLVRGLGFGLDFRGADHTTNGLEMGIDGWLYVAVGDYGAVKAVGTDGREIQMRGGGNVRVRPDGTDLEIYTRGTRNDYDLAIDPYMNLFARGNTNDGGGFDIRLYHFVAGATFGYPALFRNFSDEVVPPIADYGTGSGTGMLFVHDEGLPAPYGNALYSVDWGRNAIFRHPLKANGATFAVEQEEFLTVPRPNDMAIDGDSRLYVASWAGGQFRYAGENVGYIARLTHDKASPAAPVNLTTATDARLVELVGSNNLVRSRAAQAALVRRGRSPERIALLESRAAGGALAGRVAALFTLKQLAGTDATASLVRLAADPAVRAFALRALTDRRGETANVPTSLFVQALSDPDPRVKLEAVNGLRRLGATDAAAAMLPLAASPDPVIANVTINALVALSAVDASMAAVTGPSDAIAAGALRVLQQIHQPAVVTGLINALREVGVTPRRTGVLRALARLHNREGVWRGTLQEWWGTRPDTTGPYYDPVAWDESARIRGVLMDAVTQAAAAAAPQAELTRLTADLERNRVLPPGGADVLTVLGADRHALFAETTRALLGRVRIDVDTAVGQTLDRVVRAQARYRPAVARLAVAAGAPTPAAAALMQTLAIDTSLAADVRAPLFTALAAATGSDALRRAIDAFSALALPTLDAPLDAVWTQFVASPAHAGSVTAFQQAAGAADPSHQRLGYAVLLRLAAEPPVARGGAAPGRGGAGGGRGRGGAAAEAVVQAARAEARQLIEAAWTGPNVESLVWAVGRTQADQYRDRLAPLMNSSTPAIREAAVYATGRLAALPSAPAPVPSTAAAGPVVTSVPYEELVARVAAAVPNVAAGRQIFEQRACGACHTTVPTEPEKGPYLGGIFTRYSRAEVIESILRPSARVAQGFASNAFTLTDGRQLSGFVVREGQEDVVIRDLTGSETSLRKSLVSARTVSEGSMMPAGLVDTLTVQDLASLLAFLESTTAK